MMLLCLKEVEMSGMHRARWRLVLLLSSVLCMLLGGLFVPHASH